MTRNRPSGADKTKRAQRRLLGAVNRSIVAAEQAKQALAELYRLADSKKKGSDKQ